MGNIKGRSVKRLGDLILDSFDGFNTDFEHNKELLTNLIQEDKIEFYVPLGRSNKLRNKISAYIARKIEKEAIWEQKGRSFVGNAYNTPKKKKKAPTRRKFRSY